MTWIVASDRLSAGAAVCNQLDADLFEQFLNYAYIKSFGSDEEKQRVVENIQQSEVFSQIDKAQLNLTVKTITYIIKRAINFIMKPEVMTANLIEIASFSKEKAETLTKFWMTKTKEILEGVSDGRELIDVHWDLKTELSSAAEQRARNAIGILRLETADADRLTLELDHQELSTLYMTIEGIQEELDALEANKT